MNKKDELKIKKEITYYKSLPVVFDGFIDLPELSDGVIHLVCTKKERRYRKRNMFPHMTSPYAKAAKKSER
jgi:hypothetical protein